LILAFAVALQDGDEIAFKTHGSFFNANYQYLNAGTVDGSVGMAANTDYNTASGTWWRAHLLSDGSWAFESLGSIPNDEHIYLNANTYTGSVNLAASTDEATLSGTHWSLQTLSDGTVALESLGSHSNPNFVYLNAGTVDGSIGMAASTDFASASGTHWEIDTLVPASAGGAAVAVGGVVTGAVNGAIGAAGGAVNGAVGAVTGVVNGAIGAAGSAVNGAVGAATGAAGDVAGAATNAAGAVSGAVGGAVGAIEGLF